jgi:hypothetical protein
VCEEAASVVTSRRQGNGVAVRVRLLQAGGGRRARLGSIETETMMTGRRWCERLTERGLRSGSRKHLSGAWTCASPDLVVNRFDADKAQLLRSRSRRIFKRKFKTSWALSKADVLSVLLQLNKLSRQHCVLYISTIMQRTSQRLEYGRLHVSEPRVDAIGLQRR